MFFWVALSVPDTAAVNPKRTKTLFINGLNTLPIKDKPVFLLIVQEVYLKILLIVPF